MTAWSKIAVLRKSVYRHCCGVLGNVEAEFGAVRVILWYGNSHNEVTSVTEC